MNRRKATPKSASGVISSRLSSVTRESQSGRRAAGDERAEAVRPEAEARDEKAENRADLQPPEQRRDNGGRAEKDQNAFVMVGRRRHAKSSSV